MRKKIFSSCKYDICSCFWKLFLLMFYIFLCVRNRIIRFNDPSFLWSFSFNCTTLSEIAKLLSFHKQSLNITWKIHVNPSEKFLTNEVTPQKGSTHCLWTRAERFAYVSSDRIQITFKLTTSIQNKYRPEFWHFHNIPNNFNICCSIHPMRKYEWIIHEYVVF